ncbi:hypothetical protein LEMLEM_LOCUS11249 [Lemmus lemmus]
MPLAKDLLHPSPDEEKRKQKTAPGTEPLFLLYGCEPCTDGLVCQPLHCPLSAYRRESKTDRRMLLQRKQH